MTENHGGSETERDAKKQRSNLKRVARIHGVAALAAITLWGAADNWAVGSDWFLARAVAIVNAVVAATVLAAIVHEWGHFAGARLSGAVTEVFEKPARYYFIFNFPFDRNDRRQFLRMSWGGIAAPWLLVLATLWLVPIDNPSRAMLLAVLVARAAQAAIFEVPVALRTTNGGEPLKELERQVVRGFATSRYAGFALGALVFVLA